MIEKSDQEKATNIINSINSINIPELENSKKIQNVPQQNSQKDNGLQANTNNENLNENIASENTNTTVSNENTTYDQNSNLNQTSSSEMKQKKKSPKGMKDLAFKFPISNAISRVEIPFSFQNNLNSQNDNNCFHTYITIKNTPKLYIDISDDIKMDKFLLSNNIESLKETNQKKTNKLQSIDSNIMQYKKENEILFGEIEKLKREILISNQNIYYYNKKYLQIINLNNKNMNETDEKLKEKSKIFEKMKENYENVSKEMEEINCEEKKNEILYKIEEQINFYKKNNNNNLNYFKNKFFHNINISEDYIHQILQKDILDFLDLVTYKIKKIKPKVNELINFIQNSVEKSIGKEYEIKLYGSHATGLCLPWSDIDVVLYKKNGKNNKNDDNNSYNNKYMPLQDLFTYLQKNNDFKSINYIGATSVPLIKIKTNENIDIKNVDISLQDNKHYGIECVSLVLNYMKEFEVLLPMALALKNILKQANLNDPYTVSKYNIYIIF